MGWLITKKVKTQFAASIGVASFALTGRYFPLFIVFIAAKLLCCYRLTPQVWARLFPHIDMLNLRRFDSLRIVLQLIWLALVKQSFSYNRWMVNRHLNLVGYCCHQVTTWWRLTLHKGYYYVAMPLKRKHEDVVMTKKPDALMMIVLTMLAVLCITVPFSLSSQALFVSILAIVALVVRPLEGRFPNFILIILSLIASCRYIWWRYTSTLNWDKELDLFLGLILLFAETYSWLVLILSYFQSAWPLNRKPSVLPSDTGSWPSIDLYIPTYNEDLNVIKATVYAAQSVDWPEDKLNIYILDDGKRDAFETFADQAGVGYIRRPTNEHAKAGNLNYALSKTQGEFIAIFDCDHIPTRAFFQLTMGAFLENNELALIQTPHHFFSADPFEKNLSSFKTHPNEGNLFYGLIQDGNDMWNASFFCGSCAILRRGPLEEVGGIAIETVTEDAHTALKLHRLGYQSAYLREPISAGLATDSLSAHIGQRIRWARGMAQIFRLDNPLFSSGLTWQQRICYFNGMIHFLSGIPRLIFMIAPLAFLLFDAYIIYAPALMIVMFVLPNIFHANIANSRIQGKYRHSFWGELYETVLAWYIAIPTTVALFAPHRGNFNVTQKGGLIPDRYFDWNISKPILGLLILNFVGAVVGIYRLLSDGGVNTGAVWVNLFWVFYNLMLLGMALAVAAEEKQVRSNHRIELEEPVTFKTTGGYQYPAILKDFSFSGLGLSIHPDITVSEGEHIYVVLQRYGIDEAFLCEVKFASEGNIGVALLPMSVEKERYYIQCTFARSDTWSKWQQGYQEDKPLRSFINVMKISAIGFRKAIEFGPSIFMSFIKYLEKLMKIVLTYHPKWIE